MSVTLVGCGSFSDEKKETKQEAIVFALIHLDGITNSTDVYENLALKEVLEKSDESFASYDVADKWTTLKVIGDDITSYTVAVKE